MSSTPIALTPHYTPSTPLCKTRAPYTITNIFGHNTNIFGHKKICSPGDGDAYGWAIASMLGFFMLILKIFITNNAGHCIPLFFLFMIIITLWCWSKGTLRDMQAEKEIKPLW